MINDSFLIDVTEIFRASPQQLVFASLWMTGLVSPKNISCIDFFLYIVQHRFVAVGNDGL